MNSDVRDILQLQTVSPKDSINKSKLSKKKSLKRLIEPIKRPQGVHREVWGLICTKTDEHDQTTLIPSQEPTIYAHAKANLRHGVRKWHWIEFTNPARSDNATFSHWRCVNDDKTKEYPFAKYNKTIQFYKYTDAEYNQYLIDDNWTKYETDYLFDLCKRFDLRFFIIHDRWQTSNDELIKITRTIDQLKDRYYKVTGIMQKLKTSIDEQLIYQFDLEHEQKRREQLEKLFNRTKQQIDEELYLMEELKKIEIRKKERERKQQDVNKLLTAVVDLENSNKQLIKQQEHDKQLSLITKRFKQKKQLNTNPNQTKNQINPSVDQTISTSIEEANQSTHVNDPNKSNLNLNKKPLIFKAVVESTGIKFPDTKLAGVSLRSYKMKLPPSVGQKKTKAIEQLLEELQLQERPIATEVICEQFNELRSDIVLLYELQQALTNCEFELQSFRHRYESIITAKNIDMSLFDISLSSSTCSLVSSLSSNSNTPNKRISDMFDVSVASSAPLERRRKAALNQGNILKRLRGRNAT